MPGTRQLHSSLCPFSKEYLSDLDAHDLLVNESGAPAMRGGLFAGPCALQELWKAAELHIWRSSFKHRSWALIRRRLLAALVDIKTTIASTANERIFIPEPFNDATPESATIALRQFLEGCSMVDTRGYVIAPVKAVYLEQSVPVLVLRHLPRTRILVRELPPPPALHCMAILRVFAFDGKVYGSDVEYLAVTEDSWLPTASGQHALRVLELAAAGANFQIDLPFINEGGACTPLKSTVGQI